MRVSKWWQFSFLVNSSISFNTLLVFFLMSEWYAVKLQCFALVNGFEVDGRGVGVPVIFWLVLGTQAEVAGISEPLILSVLTQCQTDALEHNLCRRLQCCKSPHTQGSVFFSHLYFFLNHIFSLFLSLYVFRRTDAVSLSLSFGCAVLAVHWGKATAFKRNVHL